VNARTIAATLALSLLASSSAFAQAPAAKPAGKGTPAKPAAPAAPEPPKAPEPPPGPPSLAETLSGDAKADYESGKLLFADGDSAGAAIKFQGAYEKSKDPRLLWNLAAAEKNLRHYSRAIAQLRKYVAEGGDKITDQDRADAQDLIKVMEPFTAKLKITVNEPGAEVYVDEEPIGTTPVEPVVVDLGARKVRVRKAEFEEVTKEIPVGGAAELPVDVQLVKIVHEGRINVRVKQDATIAIDGKVVGAGTWSGALPSGGHLLRVTAPKMQPYQSEVYVQDKENRDINITLEPEPTKGVPAWVWIGGGALLVAGVTTAAVVGFAGAEGSYEGPRGNLTGVGNSPGGVAELSRLFW